jgi:HlyD family secretion protein
LSTVVSTLGTILIVLPMIEEMRHLIDETEGVEAAPAVRTNRFADWKEISTTALGYTYDTGKQAALHGIDVHFEFGKVYGLAGPSGAGKSTLVDILSGLLEPRQGEINVDGELLARGQLHEWRTRIGYVSQLPFMLDATLRENIAFGIDPALVDEPRLGRIVDLTKLAELVAELPEGLDTRIGESAVRLSGGQRQRVAIARALYQDVRLLIFDEATSALDNLTEREIRNTIAGLAGELTIILIAHRMSTITECDKIYVLDQGCLIAEGRYDELLESCPLFRDMAGDTARAVPVDAVAAK